MAYPLTPGGIDALLQNSAEAGAAPVLQVVALYRLALDATWFAATHETVRPEGGDAFDLVLSDGVHTLKCVLSTALNPRIYRGWLRRHSIVRISSWRRLVDERLPVTGAPVAVVVFVNDLKAVWLPSEEPAAEEPAFTRVLPCIGQDELVPHPSASAAGAVGDDAAPLLGQRQHYLRTDADEVLLTERWGALAQPAPDEDDEAEPGAVPAAEAVPELVHAKLRMTDEAVPSAQTAPSRVLGEAPAQRGRPRSKGDIPPLVGRIVRVGPLRFFGGLHERHAMRYAVCATVWVRDATGELPVTLWNRQCESLYMRLCRASLVVVRGYRLGLWRTGFDEGMTEWRANVNTTNPTGSVVAIDEGALADAWGDDVASRRLPPGQPPLTAATRTALVQAAADLAAARATADRSTDREAMNGDAAEVPSFAPSEEGVGEAVTAWGHDPDVVGEACTPPVDVACVVVRAFAPFRQRLPTSARRPTVRFVRVRWLLVLLPDGDAPLPLLLPHRSAAV